MNVLTGYNFMRFVILVFLAIVSSSVAQTALESELRINGKKVWAAFEPQRSILQTSSAVIYTDEKSRVKSVYGIVATAEGHILTKASELLDFEYLSVRVDNKLYDDVELLGIDEEWDVAMLKIQVEEEVFTPVSLSSESDISQGHWVISNGSTTRRARRVRVGVVSAITREIKKSFNDVSIGIEIDPKELGLVKILEVTLESGAEDAGLMAGDIITEAGTIAITEHEDILKSIEGKSIGDTLLVKVKREGELMEFEVELKARSGAEGGIPLSRNDVMGGGVESLSERRDNFPRVLQHDTPLTKVSVGGPLLTIKGECVGMNIARASRVATYAIPAKELGEIIERMAQ